MALSIEEAALRGWHLVHKAEELVRFETVVGGSARGLNSTSVEAGLAEIERLEATHPGASSDRITRSDGLHESLDALQVQAGLNKPESTPSGTGTDVNEGTTTSPDDLPAEPEAPAEPEVPEGAVAS